MTLASSVSHNMIKNGVTTFQANARFFQYFFVSDNEYNEGERSYNYIFIKQRGWCANKDSVSKGAKTFTDCSYNLSWL